MSQTLYHRATQPSCVCVYVYLPSCSIQGLSYTHVVLSPYLYLSFFFQLLYILCHYHLFFQSIPSMFLWRKLYFCIIQANSFLQFFLVSHQIFSLSCVYVCVLIPRSSVWNPLKAKMKGRMTEKIVKEEGRDGRMREKEGVCVIYVAERLLKSSYCNNESYLKYCFTNDCWWSRWLNNPPELGNYIPYSSARVNERSCCENL